MRGSAPDAAMLQAAHPKASSRDSNKGPDPFCAFRVIELNGICSISSSPLLHSVPFLADLPNGAGGGDLD